MSTTYHWKPLEPCETNPIPSWLATALADEYGVLPITLNGGAKLYLRGVRSTLLGNSIDHAAVNKLIAAIGKHGSIRVMTE